jgi:tRNA pseudouridine32 synthase/23S rRNA pseudouridine746 synthase
MTSKEKVARGFATKTHASRGISPDEMLARVLHRDGLMLIVDKPPGLSVHRGPKGGPSLEDYFDALRYGLPRPPALAHRLDKDTSGCLVLGRHRKALAHLGLLFKHRKVGKTYWAVVEGGPDEQEGTIDIPLGRLDDKIGWWMKPDPKGLPSVTKWKVMGRSFPSPYLSSPSPVYGGGGSPTHGTRGFPLPASFACAPPPQAGEGAQVPLTWLALEPITGRTHQLRVHCEVVVPISKNRPPIRVVAPVPPHMRERLVLCGWNGEEGE